MWKISKKNKLFNKKSKTMTPGVIFGVSCFAFCLVVIMICVVLMMTEHKDNKNLSEKELYNNLNYSGDWDLYEWNKELTECTLIEEGISFPYAYRGNSVISYKKIIAGDIGTYDRIFLHTNYQVLRIFVGGENVSIFNAQKSEILPEIMENPWTAFVMNPDMQGKELEIRLLGYGDKARKEVYSILRGSNSDIRWVLMLDAMTSEIPCIIVGLILMLVLIMTAIIGGKFGAGGVVDSLYLSLFVLLSLLWIYTDSTMQGAFFVGSKYFRFINLFSYELFLVPFMLYVRRLLKFGKPFCLVMALAQSGLTILTLITMPLNLFHFDLTLSVSHVMTGVTQAGMFFISIYELWKYRKKENWGLLIGLSIICSAGLISIFQFYFRCLGDNTSAFKYGILVFVALLCINGISRSIRVIANGHLFQGITETIPTGICRLHVEEEITLTYANDFFFMMFGYSEPEKNRKLDISPQFLIFPEDYIKYTTDIRNNFESKCRYCETEVRYVTKDNQIKWCLERHEYDTENSNVTATVYDITARKEMEVQLRKSEEETREEASHKTEFLANMSHEIRTPMNVISGMTDILDSMTKDSVSKEYIGMIRTASNNLLGIINDILDFTKIDSGRMELVDEKYSFSKMMNEILTIIAPKMSKNMLRFLVYAEPTIPDALIGDEGRVKQILINLLNNAAKFTSKGEVSLTVKKVSREGKKVLLSFAVRDTGVGIREEDMDKLFTQFSRVDTKKNRSIEGTGLGLALCKDLTQKMNGDVQLESVYGEGCIFTATIEQEVASEETLSLSTGGEKFHVLILEEDSVREQSICQAIEDIGVQTIYTKVEDIIKDPGEYPVILYDYSVYSMVLHQMPELKNMFQIAMLEYGLKMQKKVEAETFLQKPICITNLSQYFTPNGVKQKVVVEERKSLFSIKNARIAVVDDNELNLKVAEGLLKRFNIKPVLLTGGRVLIEEMKKGISYDLVFLDHMMPDMDGIETIQFIRNEGTEEWKKMPIIALTANAIKGVEQMFLNAGMTDYLFKPIDKVRLAELLEKYLHSFCVYEEKDSIASKSQNAVRIEKLPKIPGINVMAAMTMIGGSLSEYFELVVGYINQIEVNCVKLQRFLEEHDSRQYTILVHMIKSSARIVGNEALADTALHLEQAGNDENWNEIIAGTELFLNRYKAQRELFYRFLPPEYQEEVENPTEVSDKEKRPVHTFQVLSEVVQMKLTELQTSLEDFDDESAMMKLKEITSTYPEKEVPEELIKLRKLIQDVEYEEAIILVKKLHQTI